METHRSQYKMADALQMTFQNIFSPTEYGCILNQIPRKFDAHWPNVNKSFSTKKASRRTDDKPLSEPMMSLQLRYNERDGVLNHQRHDCLLNRLFRRRSKKTSKLRGTGFCGEFAGDRWIPRTMGQ